MSSQTKIVRYACNRITAGNGCKARRFSVRGHCASFLMNGPPGLRHAWAISSKLIGHLSIARFPSLKCGVACVILFRKESSCQFFDINPGKIWFIMRSYLLIAYVEGLLRCLSTTLRAYPAKDLSLESSVSLTCS